MKLPVANFLTISADLVGDLQSGILLYSHQNYASINHYDLNYVSGVGYVFDSYSNDALINFDNYESITIRNQNKLVPNVKFEFHIPLYKIWSK